MSIWGNYNLDTAFTINLYRKNDLHSRKPYKKVRVFAANFAEAWEIARLEAASFNLTPRQPDALKFG